MTADGATVYAALACAGLIENAFLFTVLSVLEWMLFAAIANHYLSHLFIFLVLVNPQVEGIVL